MNQLESIVYRTKWKQVAATSADRWPNVLFIGTQAGCAQAFKDCGIADCDRYVWGLNKAQYLLASTGNCPPKLLKEQLRGRKMVY